MNLYKLHSEPAALDHFEKVSETNPDVFWEKYKKNKEELKKREKHIAKNASFAHLYAKDVLKGPFPAGEEAIITKNDALYVNAYARDVLKGPFPAGEAAIAKSPHNAYHYAKDVLKGPFPAGEEAIAKKQSMRMNTQKTF